MTYKYLLIAIGFAIPLTSCGESDDSKDKGPNGPSARLLGTWQANCQPDSQVKVSEVITITNQTTKWQITAWDEGCNRKIYSTTAEAEVYELGGTNDVYRLGLDQWGNGLVQQAGRSGIQKIDFKFSRSTRTYHDQAALNLAKNDKACNIGNWMIHQDRDVTNSACSLGKNLHSIYLLEDSRLYLGYSVDPTTGQVDPAGGATEQNRHNVIASRAYSKL